jgi:signal transduction histidine kinase/pSer/pThr/pTyr-binding forkhead associated (FHA) protein
LLESEIKLKDNRNPKEKAGKTGFYLVVEKGPLKESLVPLEHQMTIGRTSKNDLVLKASSVSREHAVIHLIGGEPVLEDLGSRNGTFLNDVRIEEPARLADGDLLRVGGIRIRVLQEKEAVNNLSASSLTETQDMGLPEVDETLEGEDAYKKTGRLAEILAGVSMFSELDRKHLEELAQQGILAFYDAGKEIVGQGDPGQFLGVPAEGKVRAVMRMRGNEELPLRMFSFPECFGELSFITGTPCTATCRAEQDTLVLKLGSDVLQDIFSKAPSVKAALEEYHEQQLIEREWIKKGAGFVEDRRSFRVNTFLSANLEILPTHGATKSRTWTKRHRSVCLDLSVDGARISILDESLFALPIETVVHLEISLPQPWGLVRSSAVLKHATRKKVSGGRGYLGLAFRRMRADHRKKLEHFLDALIQLSHLTQNARLVERQLIRSHRLASMGLLMSGMFHEIKNLNNCLLINVPVLRDYFKELLPILDEYARSHPGFHVAGMGYEEWCEDLVKLLDTMEHASNRIDQSAADWRLQEERGETQDRIGIDVNRAAERAMAVCRPYIEKKVKTLDINLAESLPAVAGDPDALEQVLVNLLINAADAADKEDSWISLKTRLNGGTEEVVIEIRDNGCGMDQATQKEIFDLFFTTKAEEGGSGLGLFISQRLVEEMGGRMEMASEPGRGSVFRIVLSSTTSVSKS